MQRTRHGFTLVELLVVITIIGILMALIIPAVGAVREQSRQANCINNEQQIGQAILSYELAKRQLPGVMNQVSGFTPPVPYSWAEAIFPNLDRSDLWDKVHTNQTAAIQTMRVAILICPDDPLTVNPTAAVAQALLSYGVNDQFFVDNRSLPPVDRSGTNKVGQAVVSNLKTRPNFPSASFPRGQTVTTSQTIMLGERTFPDSSQNRATKWFDPAWLASPPPPEATYWNELAFPWPSSQTPISPGIMGSTHGSTMITLSTTGKTAVAGTVVIITYFDGHTEKVASDAQYPL